MNATYPLNPEERAEWEAHMTMLKAITGSREFTFTIDLNTEKDYAVVEVVCEVSSGNTVTFRFICENAGHYMVNWRTLKLLVDSAVSNSSHIGELK